jgi:hypothetical protein
MSSSFRRSSLAVLLSLGFTSGCATKPNLYGYCPAPAEYAGRSTKEILNRAKEIVANGKEKRAVVFGLYGNNPKYTEGLMRNLYTFKELYPNWDAVVFMDSASVPAEIVARAKATGAVVKTSPNYNHASARFYIADMKEYDRFVVRDCDSRLMLREVAAVADWIEQDWAILHGMRDTKGHLDPLLGGMWGARSQELRNKLQAKFGNPSLQDLYEEYIAKKREGKEAIYGDDQGFLKEVVLQAVGEESFLSHETTLCHAFSHSRGFPVVRSATGPFIGQVVEKIR